MRETFQIKLFLAFAVLLAAMIGIRGEARADGASLYISPASGIRRAGETFALTLRVDTGGEAINAGEMTLSYDPDHIVIVSISKNNSIFKLWTTEPSFSNDSGTLSLGGGIPSPGFNSPSGLLLTLNVKMISAGTASLSYVTGSILANDGNGTNILTSSRSASYTLAKPAPSPTPTLAPSPMPIPPRLPLVPIISSPTHPLDLISHPDSEHWDNAKEAEFDWKAEADAMSFSYVLDQNPSTVPDEVSEGSLTAKIYPDIEDGIWFFHVRARNIAGWSQAAHYEIHSDKTPPESFSVEVQGGRDLTDSSPNIKFGTKDVMSGIAYYTVQLGQLEAKKITPEEASKSLSLGALQPGTYAIQVTAYDRAGNATEAYAEFTIHSLEPPVLTVYPKTVAGSEAFFVEGRASPDTSVVLTFKQEDAGKTFERQTSTDAAGNWSYYGKNLDQSGIWTVEARTKDRNGVLSEKSSNVNVEVLQTALRVGPYELTYAGVSAIGAGIVAGVVLIVSLVVFRYRKRLHLLRGRVAKEVEEAENAVNEGFATLKEDVIWELQVLDSVRAQRELTEEELVRREKLLKDLAFIEKKVMKEVKDIEDVIGGGAGISGNLPEPPPPQ